MTCRVVCDGHVVLDFLTDHEDAQGFADGWNLGYPPPEYPAFTVVCDPPHEPTS